MRDSGRLRRLAIEGAGVGSLKGIERMSALDTLYLERLRSPELAKLAQLPALRTLVLDRVEGQVDYAALGALTGLEYLSLTLADVAAGQEVAAVELSRLKGLRVLKLMLPGERVLLRAPWLTQLTQLEQLVLEGFVLRDNDLALLIAGEPPLQRVMFTPASATQRATVLNSPIGPVSIDVADGGVAPLDTIFEHELGDRTEYSLGLDLAESLQIETNVEAETRLIELLHARAPELLDALRFDTESSAVWLVSERRDVLEAARILAADVGRAQ